MFVQYLLIPFSLLLLFLTRRKLTIELGKLIRRFGGENRAFAIIWSIIFLPGTIIHEMSHFFAAAFTGTRIGKVEIFPSLPRQQAGLSQKEIRLGSVETQQLGLLRGFLVGGAPFLVGLGILVWLANNMKPTTFIASLDPSASLGTTERILPFLQLYLFFTIANSLFLSWVDLKHTLPLIVVAIIVGALLYFSGIQPTITPNSLIIELFDRLQTALLFSVGINTIATAFLWTINRL